ncbi:MAG TPA: zinc ribbon domain-containing protein [Kofleriaceae bacterium]|nr:zinc ribbon domain-containing protein [Kofleriaceae bacterium]
MSAHFCGHCGAQIPFDSIFCPMCGWRAGASAAPRRTPVHPHQAQPEPPPFPGPAGFAAPDARGGIRLALRPMRIAAAALFFGLAVLLAVWFSPGDRSMSDAAQVASSMAVAALALAGVGLVVSGLLGRGVTQVRCRRCAQTVDPWKGVFGLHCPLGPHYARVHWFMVGLTAAFWLGLLMTAAVVLLWLA